jgi:8-oxo-dGTP diphosphatase
LDRDQVTRMMSEAFAIRLLDAFDIGGPHVRVHDGEQLLG